MCRRLRNILFIIERVVSNDSRNSIHVTSEHHTKRTRFSEKNIINGCAEENTNSCFCSAEQETNESENKWD